MFDNDVILLMINYKLFKPLKIIQVMLSKLINIQVFIKKLCCLALLCLVVTHSYANSFEEDWTPLYKGIDYRLVVKNNGVLKIHQMRIDTDDPDVELFTTAPTENGRETVATKPSTFLKREKAQVVINGTGYYPANLSLEGARKVPETRAIYKGVQYAEPREENAAFIVLYDGTKKIIKAEEFPIYEGSISMALGAWPWAGVRGLLIEEGVSLVPDELIDDQITARTALGISDDGKSLYLVTVEGKPWQASIFKDLVGKGVSLIELARIMQELGCQRAINLDGGGSATMVVENIINNKPLVLNVPSDHKGERAAGSHLGIRALHIMDEEQLKTFRALQENAAFFDLLNRSPGVLSEAYMDDVTLERLGFDNTTSVEKLYERFGISQYSDFNVDYQALLKARGKSFDECFFQNQKYDFYCGDPKVFLDQLDIKISEYIMRLSDLKFVGEKQTGFTQGGTYMDANKVFYFVKNAQSVKNELIGSKLMNLILGTDCTPVIKLLEDNPGMVASRMIRGFGMAMDANKIKDADKGKKIIGAVDLAIAMDFIGLIDRHTRNMGYVGLDAQTRGVARVDYDHSFAFGSQPIGVPNLMVKHDPVNLMHLYLTLEQYPSRDIIPVIERVIATPDEQLVMLVFGCWTALAEIGDPFSLDDSFNLASQLIERKGAFKKALLEIKELNKRKGKEKDKLAFVRDLAQVYNVGEDRFKLEEIANADKVSLLINDVKVAEFDINDQTLKGPFEYANEIRTYIIRLGKIRIDRRNFVNIEDVEVIETAKLKAEEEARKAAEEARIKEEQRIAAEAARIREEQRIAAEAARVREAQRVAAEAARMREERRIAAEAARVREEQRIAAEAVRVREEQRIAENARKEQRAARKAEKRLKRQERKAEKSRKSNNLFRKSNRKHR